MEARRLGAVMLVLGVVLAALFLALAPRSPLYPWVAGLLGAEGVSLAGDLVGAAALALVAASYVVHQFESHPRPLALYNTAQLLVYLAWLAAAGLVYSYLAPWRGLAGYLASLLASSPVVVAGYLLLRRLEARARRARGGVIVVVSSR
ncbi:MAG: hypothetical protein GSR80_001375 [Desulfurococcales archaeon]|nr:hypothetical protein [Desulfurococcales archaeon]